MKFGITLALAHSSLWPKLTRRADELGYESVWLPEHLVLPVQMAGSPHHGHDHPPIPPQTPVFDAMGYLSFLAGQTQNIRFGTQVYNIGLGTRSSAPAPPRPSTSSRAAGSTSGSAPAGCARSGTPPVWTSTPAERASTKRWKSAVRCGTSR